MAITGVNAYNSAYENVYAAKQKEETKETDLSGRRDSNTEDVAASSLIDDAISMEISERGRALAGEMEPFLDTYETTCNLLRGIGHIGSEQMMNGGFADVLTENYQKELQRIKENYSGKEYDRQLAVLDKAYEEAAQSASRGYVKQLKILTGDIVIKPQTGASYASEAEAEKAYQADLEKDGNRNPVIDSALSDTIYDDVKNILLQLKNMALNQQDEKNNIRGDFMSYADVRKFASYLKDAAYGANDVSDFSKLILEKYAARKDQ